MTQPSDILKQLNEMQFVQIFKETPKQLRELVFDKFRIKTKPTTPGNSFAVPGEKDQHRSKLLFSVLIGTKEEQIIEEIFRNYLLKRRPLLIDALNYLEIPHQEGLTETDITRFQEMTAEEAKKLQRFLLDKKHMEMDVMIYLRLMKAKI